MRDSKKPKPSVVVGIDGSLKPRSKPRTGQSMKLSAERSRCAVSK